MAKEKIPVYTIPNLAARSPGSGDHPRDPGDHPQDLSARLLTSDDFMLERFGPYLDRQSAHLHSPHRHIFYHLVYFSGGSGSHSIDFTRFPVEAGQIYFMTPGQVHSWSFADPPDGYVLNFSEGFLRSFLLNPNYLDRFSFFGGVAADCVVALDGALQAAVVAVFESMLRGGAPAAALPAGPGGVAAPGLVPGAPDPDLLRAQLVQLLLLVQSGVGRGGTSGSGDGVPRVPEASPVVTQKQQTLVSLRRLMDQYHKTMRRPSEYAGMLYITPNHLNTLCQDLLGRSAGEVIRDRVLLEAKRLLTNAGMTATEIAYELNFQDNSYFNRFFKKYEGVTPDEFRRKHILK